MQKVTFAGSDGLRLAGNLYSPGSKDDKSACVIICHGFRGGKEGSGRAVVLAEKIAGLGMFALPFDFSGTGESAGEFIDCSLTKYLHDLSGAIDFMTSLTRGRIFLIGRSLGGTTSICQASGDQRVAGVCTWAAPGDLNETFLKPAQPLLESADKVFRVPEEKGNYLIGRGFFEDLVNYDVIAAVRRIAPRPVLIIHGTSDETVSVQQGSALFEAAGEPKSSLFIPGDDHRFTKHYDLVEKTTLEWLQKSHTRR